MKTVPLSEAKAKLSSLLDSVEDRDEELADPELGKALRDELEGLRSCRVGRFRNVYRSAGSVVEIVAIGPRKTIYEETWRRVRRGPPSD